MKRSPCLSCDKLGEPKDLCSKKCAPLDAYVSTLGENFHGCSSLEHSYSLSAARKAMTLSPA